MEVPENLLYTQEHEWVRVEGQKAVVGITQFAQDQLGDIVFVELPEMDTLIEQESPFGVVESVKTVSDLYAPVSGKVDNELGKLMSPEDYIEQCSKEQG